VCIKHYGGVLYQEIEMSDMDIYQVAAIYAGLYRRCTPLTPPLMLFHGSPEATVGRGSLYLTKVWQKVQREY